MRQAWGWACFLVVGCAPAVSNPGPSNDAGTCRDAVSHEVRALRPVPEGALEISEWMANPKAVDDPVGEWFEIHAQATLDLNGLSIEVGATSQTLASEDCLGIESGDYAVLAKKSDPSENGGLPDVLTTFRGTLGNTSGSVRILQGTDVLAEVAWTKTSEGISTELNQSCPPSRVYGKGDKGTPGLPSDPCPSSTPAADAATCLDGATGQSRNIQWPAKGQIRISEFLPNPDAVDDRLGEFVEIQSSTSADLNGLRFGNGTSSQTLSSPHCLHIMPWSRSLLARSSDSTLNGGLPPVLATFSLSLANDGTHSISIDLPDGGSLAEVQYPGSVPGTSWQSDPDSEAFCQPKTHRFGMGDFGTPGLSNDFCP